MNVSEQVVLQQDRLNSLLGRPGAGCERNPRSPVGQASHEQCQQQIAALERLLEESSAKLTQRQEYFRYLEQQVCLLKRENDVLMRPVSKQSTALQSSYLDRQSRDMAAIEQLRYQLSDCEAALRAKDLRIAKLQNEVREQAEMLQNAERGLIKHSETVQQQSAYFDAQTQRNMQSYEGELQSISASYAALRDERDKLKQSIVEVARENLVLKSKMLETEAQLRSSQAAVSELELSSQRLKRSKQALSRELEDLQYLSSQLSPAHAAFYSDVETASSKTTAQMHVKMVQLEQDLITSYNAEDALRIYLSASQAAHQREITTLYARLAAAKEQQATMLDLTEYLSKTYRELALLKSHAYDGAYCEPGSPSVEHFTKQLKEVQEELYLINLDFYAKDTELGRKDAEIHRLQELNESLNLQLTETAPVAEQMRTLDSYMNIDELQMSILDLQTENARLKDELELIKSRAAPAAAE